MRSVRRQLARGPRLLLVGGILLTVLFGPLTVIVARAWLIGLPPPGFLVVLFGGLSVAGVSCVVMGAHRLARLDEHPTLETLRRYGPPAEIVRDIDTELARKGEVMHIGRGMRSFALSVGAGTLYGAEAWLTRSWLIVTFGEDGSNMAFQHLPSVVWVYSDRPLVKADVPPVRVVVIDRHGWRLEIPATEADGTRLLAELMSRVPHALGRFDVVLERLWNEDRERFLSEAAQRSQDIQREAESRLDRPV